MLFKRKGDTLMFVERKHECPADKTEFLRQWSTNIVYYKTAFVIVKYQPPPQ